MATTHSTTHDSNRARTHCPECSSGLHEERGETYCPDCGLIADADWLDRGPEWTPYNRDELIRVGAPLTPARHDRGLSTEIGYGTDGKGHRLSSAKRRHLSRLRREHGRARWRSKAERNLAHGLGEVSRLAAALDVSKSVRDRAATIFREAHGIGLAPGRSIEGLAAASVYAACRCSGTLRTPSEVAEGSTASEADVLNDYNVLNRALGLGVRPFPPELYLDRLAGDFGVSDSLRLRAKSLLRKAEAAGLGNGSRPAGLAAACMYLESRSTLTQVDIAEYAGVTPVTIRTRIREIECM